MKVTLRLNPSSRLGIKGIEGDEIEVTPEEAARLLKARVIRGPLPAAEVRAVPQDVKEVPHKIVTTKKDDK